MTTKKITLKGIQKIAEEEMQYVHKTLNEEAIRKQIHNLLIEAKDRLIRDAVGLRKGWGNEIEIKQDGSYLAGAFEKVNKAGIEKLAIELMTQWFGEMTIETADKILTERDKAALRKAYKVMYMDALKSYVEDRARERAYVDAQELFEKYLSDGDDADENI